MIRKIKLIVIGRIKEEYIECGIKEYIKRLKPFCNIDIIELKDKGIKQNSSFILNIVEKYNKNNIYILDEQGKERTSIEFSQFLNSLNGETIFIIGGADGISNSIKRSYNLISISKMTFTHEMARLFFIEQLYRAFMILENRSYHK